MDKRSIWSELERPREWEALDGDARTDVLVIGGGIAGLLCAYMLTEAGVECMLVEADRICAGTTANTTAKVTSQHGLIYARLARRFGTEGARMYFDANEAALRRYRRLAEEFDFDLCERDAYLYSLTDGAALEEEAGALTKMGVSAEPVDASLPFSTARALRFRHQAEMHPLKLAYGISRGLRIYENTRVTELGRGFAKTENGVINADRIIVATHFPILNKHGLYFAKLFQQRSYVLGLESKAAVEGLSGGMYLDASGNGLSLRGYGDTLLLGGGSHRTGERGGGWSVLERAAKEYYPDAKIKYRWATQDCITLDGIPYVGRYSMGSEGIYVATGFNKWGMTSAMAAASLLTNMLLGRDDPYAKLYDPSRSILRPQLFKNLVKTTVGLITPTVPRCPHLGCALKYNAAEHSWDCPCHGSRFDEDMHLLDNPATGDAKRK